MYSWLVALHLVGLVVFLVSHAVSMWVAFRVRGETNRDVVAALLGMSARGSQVMYLGLLLLGIGGLGAAATAGWLTAPWVVASYVVIVLVIVLMYVVGAPYYYGLRDGLEGTDKVARLDDAELVARLRTSRPEPLAAIGGARAARPDRPDDRQARRVAVRRIAADGQEPADRVRRRGPCPSPRSDRRTVNAHVPSGGAALQPRPAARRVFVERRRRHPGPERPGAHARRAERRTVGRRRRRGGQPRRHHARQGPRRRRGQDPLRVRPDTADKSACTGDCATNWPPLTSDAAPTIGAGLDASNFATLARDDGSKQVTFFGHPLYYFAGDTAAGQTNGQGKGGKWFVVDATGKSVSAEASPAASAPASAATGGAAVALAKISLGNVLTGGDKGLTLYMFTPDTAKKSACTGDCATSWPPFTSDAAPTLGAGSTRRTSRRSPATTARSR